jgi:hypothetical protein
MCPWHVRLMVARYELLAQKMGMSAKNETGQIQRL